MFKNRENFRVVILLIFILRVYYVDLPLVVWPSLWAIGLDVY